MFDLVKRNAFIMKPR